jgi:hypothetical protein
VERAATIIVSVEINDGIVKAADSAGAMPSGHKLQHLGPAEARNRNGLPRMCAARCTQR